MRKCPYCAEEIKEEAKVCRYCCKDQPIHLHHRFPVVFMSIVGAFAVLMFIVLLIQLPGSVEKFCPVGGERYSSWTTRCPKHGVKLTWVSDPSAQRVPSASAPATTIDQSKLAEAENLIKQLMDAGLVTRVNPQLNEAYVNPSLWNGIDVQQKELFSRILSFYCGGKEGTNIHWVDIKDTYTGKKLAKYDVWGFKVY